MIAITLSLGAAYLFFLLTIKNEAEKIEIPAFLCVISAFAAVLAVITGYIIILFGIPATLTAFSTGLIIICAGEITILLRTKTKACPQLHFDKWNILCSLIILIISFVGITHSSYPDFLPVRIDNQPLVDGVKHLGITQDIYSLKITREKLLTPADTVHAPYSHGAHIVIALLSKGLNVFPVKMIFPLMALFIALIGVMVYNIIVNEKIGGRFPALVGGIFTALSAYSFAELLVWGFYPQVFGRFLFAAFLVVGLIYIKKPSPGKVFVLLIMLSAMLLSYFLLVPSLLIAVSYLAFLLRKKQRISAKETVAIFAWVVFLFTLFRDAVSYYLIPILKLNGGTLLTYILNFKAMIPYLFREMIPGEDWILKFFYILALIGITKSVLKRNNTLLLLITACLIAQAAFLYWGVSEFNFAAYWYHKMYFTLIIPLTVFAVYGGQGAADLIKILLMRGVKIEAFLQPLYKITQLIIFMPFAYLSVYSSILYSQNIRFAITPCEYRAASWFIINKAHEASGRVFLFNPEKFTWDDWYLKSFLQKKRFTDKTFIAPTGEAVIKWLGDAKKGDYLLVSEKFSSFIRPFLPMFKIIYKDGGAYLLSPP